MARSAYPSPLKFPLARDCPNESAISEESGMPGESWLHSWLPFVVIPLADP